MFRRIGDSIRRFMYGRYGSDELNVALLIFSVVFSLLNTLLSLFLHKSRIFGYVIYPLLHLLVMVSIALCMCRALSRNIYKRRQENSRFRILWSCLTDRHNRYFRCPKCKQTVRVPKHRGKISIRCPKCGEKFIRKT